ncbi:hypothetical protein F4604DRAFT_1674560 [Suillus subluteus]|nr:hypothetical protein F4604DRAFT_1674560 [Suillus subluteus]
MILLGIVPIIPFALKTSDPICSIVLYQLLHGKWRQRWCDRQLPKPLVTYDSVTCHTYHNSAAHDIVRRIHAIPGNLTFTWSPGIIFASCGAVATIVNVDGMAAHSFPPLLFGQTFEAIPPSLQYIRVYNSCIQPMVHGLTIPSGSSGQFGFSNEGVWVDGASAIGEKINFAMFSRSSDVQGQSQWPAQIINVIPGPKLSFTLTMECDTANILLAAGADVKLPNFGVSRQLLCLVHFRSATTSMVSRYANQEEGYLVRRLGSIADDDLSSMYFKEWKVQPQCLEAVPECVVYAQTTMLPSSCMRDFFTDHHANHTVNPVFQRVPWHLLIIIVKTTSKILLESNFFAFGPFEVSVIMTAFARFGSCWLHKYSRHPTSDGVGPVALNLLGKSTSADLDLEGTMLLMTMSYCRNIFHASSSSK